MTDHDRRRTRLFIQICLGAALVAWAAQPALAKLERPGPAAIKASVAKGPAAPAPVDRRVPADTVARLVLGETGLGPMFRFFEGDQVSFASSNPASSAAPIAVKLPIASEGGGLAISPTVGPGKTATVLFRAEVPGLYLYRADPVGQEGEGMCGLILVEPTYGYGRADREFFLVVDRDGDSLADEDALMAQPGERIRLFVGNADPEAVASLTFEGSVVDAGVVQDGVATPLGMMQVDIEAHATTILELDAGETGEIALLTKIDGTDGPRVVIHVEKVEVVEEATPAPAAAGGLEMTPELEAKIAAGKEVYGRTCIACHQATGLGIPGVYPPLAASDYLQADVDRAIHGVIKGQEGEITVNGAKYNMLMPPQLLNDEEIAQVVTYVMSSFGNPGEDVAVERVKAIREKAQ